MGFCRLIMMVLTFLFTVGVFPLVASADWQAELEAQFDIVDTFDPHGDWTPTYDAGDVYADLPGIWNYYSNWSGGVSGDWIGTHSQTWQEESPKNLKIAYSSRTGPSRFGTYFGDTQNPSATSGYTDMYLFYMVYFPLNSYPTNATQTGCGTWSYSSGSSKVWTGYYKHNTFNKGCTDAKNACGLYPDGRNYSTYHIVPQLNVYDKYGGDKSAPGLNVQTTDNGNYTYIDPQAPQVPQGQWIGIEYHLRNYSDAGKSKVDIEIWYYTADGMEHVMTPLTTDVDNSQSATDAWNSFFFGGNACGSPDGSLDLSYFVDDFIIDDSRIGKKYFQLLGGSSTLPPSPPIGLRIVNAN